MAEPYGTNGAVDVTDDGAVDLDVTDDGEIKTKATHREETLFGVFRRLIDAVFFPGSTSAGAAAPLFRRIKNSLAENGPLLREASTNSGRNVLLWTRRGSPLRALLVISVANQCESQGLKLQNQILRMKQLANLPLELQVTLE